MASIYKDPSIGNSINVVVVKIVVLEGEQVCGGFILHDSLKFTLNCGTASMFLKDLLNLCS